MALSPTNHPNLFRHYSIYQMRCTHIFKINCYPAARRYYNVQDYFFSIRATTWKRHYIVHCYAWIHLWTTWFESIKKYTSRESHNKYWTVQDNRYNRHQLCKTLFPPPPSTPGGCIAFEPKPSISSYVYQSLIKSAYVSLWWSYQLAQIPKLYGDLEGGTGDVRVVEMTLMVL